MITIDQLLESVDLDFEPRFVTKDKSGLVSVWGQKPEQIESIWYADCKNGLYSHLKLAEFADKDWQECIYEVPRKDKPVVNTCYNCFCACVQYFVDLKKVKRWCSLENLDNLIAQADKAERLQKAVGLAQEHLLSISDGYDIMKADAETIKRLFYAIQDEASETYKEIKQLIKE